jgi:flavin reductase (DIM6/NTAB) family NADH-FMN oxidoreductase RutF
MGDDAPYKFFATTVNLLTSSDGQGRADVMACEWTMQVGYRPLRVMVVVHRENLTHEFIQATGVFGVNLCSEEQASLANFAGNVTGRVKDKLAHPRLAEWVVAGQQLPVPMIRGCVLNAECVVEERVELGAYTGFIGRAVVAEVNALARPLFYHRGKYWGLGEQIHKPMEALGVTP